MKFSLEDKQGNNKTYLSLLDIGSTGSLLSERLVEIFDLETMKNNSTWNTNNSEFPVKRIATTRNLRFSKFANKRKVNGFNFTLART